MDELDALLNSPEYLVDPHSINHRLRAADPVHWSAAWQSWLPTRYADTRAVLDDPVTYSSGSQAERRVAHMLRDAPDDTRTELMEFWSFRGLFQSDPPAYTRYRSQMIKALMPRLERVGPRAQALSDELIDRFAPLGATDLVTEFAFPLPSTILYELLAIPPDQRPMVRGWADTLTMTFADPTGGLAIASTETLRAGYAWVRDVVRDRREHPGDDVLSLIIASDSFQTMTERDILSTVVFLLLAGQETTASLIGSAIQLLIADPKRLELVRRNPESVTGVIEETLRYESPIMLSGRTVLRPTTLGDRRLQEGDVVTILIGAANRDPERFDQPDVWNPDRDASGHVGFGHGVHFCLGASLARLEARVAIPTLLRRLPGIVLAGEPEWVPNNAFRTLRTLPITFEPSAPLSGAS